VVSFNRVVLAGNLTRDPELRFTQSGTPGGLRPDVAQAMDPDDEEFDDFEDFDDVHDPLEGFNRAVFGVNLFLDDVLIRPVTVVYRTVVPDTAKQGVHNFLVNLSAPLSAINALLQGNPDRAGTALARFITNTVVGIGGIVDVADAAGVPPFSEDFGQTMGVHGVGPGPYLVLPVFGPANVRDAGGRVADLFLDPFSLVTFYSREARTAGGARLWP
jgi:phospholipid-binding lipoprotein MlaA